MKKHLSFFFVFLFVFLIHPINTFSYIKSKDQTKNGIKLEIILKKCADYCERLTRSSLSFSCQEKVEEKIFHSHPRVGRILKFAGDKQFRKNEKNIYVYDYRFKLKEKKVDESRILIEENDQRKHEKNAQLKTKMFKYKIVIFEPIVLLSEKWQQYHDYKIIKMTKFKGEKVIVIETIPKSEQEFNKLSGKFWVRESDFSILKIEWIQTVLGGFEGVEKTVEGFDVRLFITYISEYTFEKKGIRFPSKYFIKETYIGPNQERFIRSETTVSYNDYEFFTVETEDKLEEVLRIADKSSDFLYICGNNLSMI